MDSSPSKKKTPLALRMPSSLHFILECQNPDCRFRFPVSGRGPLACPNCRQADLKAIPVEPSPVEKPSFMPPSPVCGALLDNIRSIYNVGSIFRTADGLGLEQIHLCGITATPEHPRLAKTALGSQQTIRWSYHLNAVDAVRALLNSGCQLWSLEGGPSSESLIEVTKLPSDAKIVLAVGNEITGLDPEILRLSSKILSIPMQGMKGSLNVSVAFGVAAYYLRFLNPAPA